MQYRWHMHAPARMRRSQHTDTQATATSTTRTGRQNKHTTHVGDLAPFQRRAGSHLDACKEKRPRTQPRHGEFEAWGGAVQGGGRTVSAACGGSPAPGTAFARRNTSDCGTQSPGVRDWQHHWRNGWGEVRPQVGAKPENTRCPTNSDPTKWRLGGARAYHVPRQGLSLKQKQACLYHDTTLLDPRSQYTARRRMELRSRDSRASCSSRCSSCSVRRRHVAKCRAGGNPKFAL